MRARPWRCEPTSDDVHDTCDCAFVVPKPCVIRDWQDKTGCAVVANAYVSQGETGRRDTPILTFYKDVVGNRLLNHLNGVDQASVISVSKSHLPIQGALSQAALYAPTSCQCPLPVCGVHARKRLLHAVEKVVLLLPAASREGIGLVRVVCNKQYQTITNDSDTITTTNQRLQTTLAIAAAATNQSLELASG